MTDQQKKEGFPGDQTISGVLRQAGLVQSTKELRLEPIARNPERRDYLTRRSFRVYAGGRPVCHLKVGKDLGDLRSRTQAFAEACPDIASRALFWHQSDGWDYLGTKLIDGQSLEALVIEGRLSSADALVKTQTVVSALEHTLLPSDVGAATQEMDQFQARACASPIFSGLDQQFLQSVIFPFIRSGALSGLQQTRWTNGDLIARNVLVDSRGGVRLVDYEFASRTHFYAEDWWRWRSESMLPPDALDLPDSPTASKEPWLEAYFILRHAVLIHEINGAAVAVSGLRQQMDRLVALAAAAHAGFRASVFLQPLVFPALNPSAAPAQGAAGAQLFWGSEESFCEDRSQHLAYLVNEDAKLSFMLRSVHGPLHLRIDPAEALGILNIKGIRVRRHKSSKPLIALDETTGWEAVRMGNNLLRLGDSPALNLLSLNGDPHFFLPVLAIGDSPRDLVCEVWLRFSPDLTTLPDLLRPLSSALVARTQAEAGLAEGRRTLAALTEEQTRTEEQLRQAGATVQALQSAAAQAAERTASLESELAGVRGELHARELALATVEAKAGAESAGRAQAETGLAEARRTLAALTDKQVRAEEQLRQAGATVQALQSAAAQAAERTASLESELAGVRGELHARELALATVEAKAGAESAGRAQAEAGLAEARRTLAALTEEQTRTEEQLRQANDTVQALQSAAAQATERTTSLESELAGVRRELHTREQDLATIEAKAAAESAGRAQAEAELAEARRTLAALEEALRIERRRTSVGHWQRFLLEKQLSETQPKLQAGQERLHALDTTVAQQQRQLQSLTSQLQQREDKIARMQRSLSWKSTSPLRWSRRKLLDQRFHPQPSPPPEPLQTLFAIDNPPIWNSSPANGEIVGWCLYTDGRPVGGIRARLGSDTLLAGTYGLDREDVARAHGFVLADSRACGFRIEYQLPVETTHQVFIEVLGDDSRWHPLVERTLHTSAHPRAPNDYTAWIEAFDTLTEERIAKLRKQISAIDENARPLISVIMPVYNTPERWLDRAIASVEEQIYSNWELCIADDASSEPHVRKILEKWKNKDSRIRVVFRETNGHISAASNSALEMTRGEFVALLDHDDEIPAHALAEIALCLAGHPDTDLVYSDEDKIDENGARSAPYFKPDFLPDLLLGQNCVSHLAAYRTELVRRLGGFRGNYEGSQDWDLALRVWDAAGAQRIRHIPKVLYHWRMIAGSTSREVTAKNYAVESARSAIEDHFNRIGVKVELKPVCGNHWQIVYPLPHQRPLVSIIIPTRNQADLVQICVATIFARTDYPSFEIIIVDNASDEPAALNLLSQVAADPGIRVLRYDAPFNYSAINNLAARHARGELFCFLNNDIEVIDESWLTEMVSHAIRPEIGAVGAMLLYPDNRIQHAGVLLGPGGVANHAFCGHSAGCHGYFNRARLAQNYSAVTGACMVVRKQVFDQAGGFNEQDLPIAFNDVDFCLRVRAAGYRNLWTPFARLYHHESVTRGSENTPEKQARFAREIDFMRREWGSLLDNDPAYSPNFALTIPPFDLAWPPRPWASGGL